MDNNNYSFKLRAMVVDDDMISRHLMVHTFKGHGFQVFETSQYEMAIRGFISLKPALIFLDQNLEGLCGLDIAFFIRRLAGGMYTKIFLHTTQHESELISDPNYQFIDEYVMKGDSKKLTSIIKRYRILESRDTAELK